MLDAAKPAVLVRIVEASGFGAAQRERAVLVLPDGTWAGSILRGVSDAEVDRLTMTVLGLGDRVDASREQLVRVTDADASACGLSCGGRARLVAQPLTSVPRGLWDAVCDGRPVVLATLVDAGPAPSTMLVEADRVQGTLGDDEADRVAATRGRALLADPRRAGDTVELAAGRILLDRIEPATRIVGIGGGEVLEALATLASALGWLFDAEPEGPSATLAAERLGPQDALVLTSHHPDHGPAALAAALASEAFFVGALGSRSTQTRRGQRLAALGVAAADIARIHGPVGLDLGGRTPAESALAICAEILAVRSGRPLPGLRDGAGPING